MVFEGIFKRILRGTDNSQDYRFEPDFSDDNFIKIYLKKEDEKTKIEDDFDSDVFILTSLTNLDISDDKFYFYISYDNVYELYFNNGQEIDDYKTLNLPEIYKGYIYIENLGNYIIDQKVIYSFKFKDGTNLDIKRVKNNILDVNGKLNLMPKNMYQLAKILANYNSTAQQNSDINEQFSLLKVIKDYSEFTNVLLHKKLTDEEKPILIDKIKLDFKDSGDVLEIFPVIENQDEAFNEEFLSKFDKADKIRNFYNVRHNGKDIRVIVKHKDSAEKIKRNRFLSGDEKVKFLKGDNEIFQDENFDLSLYGPRVKGIGYLTYRANESPRNIIDGSWFELPQIFTEDEPIILEPQDREVLKQSLEKLQKEKLEYVEVELHKNNKPIKLILSEEEIILEIEKINNSIKKVEDINNLEELKEIKELAKEWEEYIPYKGNYIEYEGQEAIDKQIAKVEKEGKPGKETLLIKENEENEEYVEEPEYLSREVEVKIPNSLKVALFEHQVEGLKKLQNLYIASSINSSRNGFLLADDMGLGKTLQILSFLAYLKETNELGKVLVVAPSTLLKNWDNVDGTGEIQKFFTRNLFKTLHIQGVIKKHEEKKFNYLINNSDIVFITYDSLRLNNIFMGKIKWNVMICDEIQMAKNPKTLLSIALKAQNANFKVACSATPIENSLLDLWNIVDFAMPGRLGSMKNFKQCYMNTQEKDDLKEKEKINNELVAKIGSSYLRRSKSEYLKDLPAKKINIKFLMANEYELKNIKQLNALRNQGAPPLPLIQKLVALCSHVELISNVETKDPKKLIEKSTKLKYLKEILDDIRQKNEKVVIFTVFNKMQNILARVINYWYGLNCRMLNGKTEPYKRQKFLDEFRSQDGFNVIILSPVVAGVGITLTEANHVIHYTRLWNPAKEAQATDRVYRIGQQNEVFVYYPILTFDNQEEIKFENEDSYLEYFLNKQYSTTSPEERLNRILIKKKNILNNFFLAACDNDIDVVKEWDYDDHEHTQKQKVEDLIDQCLDFEEFKSLVSLIYKFKGFKAYVIKNTLNSNIGILIEKNNKFTVVVCSLNDHKAFKESDFSLFRGHKNILSVELNIRIDKILIITNRTTEQTIHATDFELFNKNDLHEMINGLNISYEDIEKENEQRYSIETLKRML